MTSQTIGAGRKACQASLANFLSFGKAALAMKCNPPLSPSGSKRAKEYRLLLQLVGYSLTLNALPKRQSEVNDTHHARSRNLSPSRVISRLRGNTRYSICCLSQQHNHMLSASILHLVRQPCQQHPLSASSSTGFLFFGD